MRLQAALQGNLKALIDKEVKDAETAVSRGVKQATDGLKQELRGQVTSAGLGNRLAQSWRGEIFPKGGMSVNAAGFVYTKAPEIIGAFATGVTIKNRRGRFLAIPTKYVIRREGRRVTPADFEEAGIPLRYIPPAKGRRIGLLVADNFRITKKGKARAASERGIKMGRVATVVMFLLIPEVSIKKRLDVDSLARKWIDQLPELVVASWPDEKEKT